MALIENPRASAARSALERLQIVQDKRSRAWEAAASLAYFAACVFGSSGAVLWGLGAAPPAILGLGIAAILSTPLAISHILLHLARRRTARAAAIYEALRR